jgi:chromosome segregation ATPase
MLRGGWVMAIIKQYHKDTDTTYVYDSVSYWNEEKGQSRSKRRLIGKIDPETGEIIPTGKRGRKPKAESSENNSELNRLYEESQTRIRELLLTINQKDLEIASLRKEIAQLKDALEKVDKYLAQCRDICTESAPRS